MSVSSPNPSAILSQPVVVPPAAGADWSFTVPGGNWLKFIMGRALFVASAAVATRYPGIQILDPGGNDLGGINVNTAAFVAGFSQRLCYSSSKASFAQIATPNAAGAAAYYNLEIPDLILPPGYTLRSYTPNIDVLDQYSGVRLLFLQWNVSPLLQTAGNVD